MKFFSLLSIVVLALVVSSIVLADMPALIYDAVKPASPYAKWSQGPSTDPGFFPIAVWMQSTRHAADYAKAGINTYVALSDDLNDQSLAALKNAGVKLIYGQSADSLEYLNDPTIIGWMHGDEPDNAQSIPGKDGYGPPILPQKIIDEYSAMVKTDPTRPVMLNLGQGVAWNEYIGRGTRTGHGEDYAAYIRGADFVSFDIYPVAGGSPETQDKLWYVPKGVDHLVQIGSGKVIWNCLECTHIGEPTKIATPHQVRSEAWMAIIHGSMGLIYFVHEFKPFKEAALLDNPEMLTAVTALNKQITSLAPVLNSPTLADGTQVQTEDKNAPVDVMVKSYQGSTYIFAAGMRDATTNATFTVPSLKLGSIVTVLGENRAVDAKDTTFTDTFAPWDVHIYLIKD